MNRLQNKIDEVDNDIREKIHALVNKCKDQHNTAWLRESLYTACAGLLYDFECRAQIYDSYAVCDETNNPPSVIESNNIVVDVNYVDIEGNKKHFKDSFNGRDL